MAPLDMALSNRNAADIADITQSELLERMRFLEFGREEVDRLTEINDLAQRYAESVIEDFYEHLLSFGETKAFFDDPATLHSST
jgi:rsbT co-antagonist protein RsbR